MGVYERALLKEQVAFITYLHAYTQCIDYVRVYAKVRRRRYWM